MGHASGPFGALGVHATNVEASRGAAARLNICRRRVGNRVNLAQLRKHGSVQDNVTRMPSACGLLGQTKAIAQQRAGMDS